MSFESPRQPLKDILEGITRIENYTRGMSFEDFRTTPMAVDAVERNLQRISEAAIRLGKQAEVMCPSIPWHNVRGMGNWLRHQYDAINLDLIWITIIDKLPALKSAVATALDTQMPDPSTSAQD